MTEKVDYSLPRLRDLLKVTNLAQVAIAIGRPRGFVWRLRHGGGLADASVIPALAACLHQPEDRILAIVVNDRRRARERKTAGR